MQKPRDIKRSRIIVALSVIVGFWALNLFAQILWGIIFIFAEPLTGAFGSDTAYYSYEFQLIGPVLLALVVVGIYTLIAYSPIGISMAKSKAGIRPIMTGQEKDYLEPLHDEVFNSIKEKYPDAEKKKLYMFDSPDINAFCINQGSDIALHRGSIQALNVEELKAVLAHEYAHAYYKDGIYSTMYAGAAFMLPFMFLLPFVTHFKSFMGIVGTGNIFAWGFAALLVWLIAKFWIFLTKLALVPVMFVVNIFVAMFEKQLLEAGQKFKEAGTYWFIQNILFMMMSKEQEYRADEFACYVGYKYGMESALHLFYSMDFQPVYGVMNKLLAEHPSNPKRIANVESFEAEV